VLPLAFFFFGMVVTGLAALQFINVPMFRCVKPSRLLQPQPALNSQVVSLALCVSHASALRRFTTLIVIVGEAVYLKKFTPRDEAWSVYAMVIGPHTLAIAQPHTRHRTRSSHFFLMCAAQVR
jgi:hypothetical protein